MIVGIPDCTHPSPIGGSHIWNKIAGNDIWECQNCGLFAIEYYNKSPIVFVEWITFRSVTEALEYQGIVKVMIS